MENGDVFVVHDSALDNLNIQSIQLTSLATDGYNGTLTPITGDGNIDNASIVCFCDGTSIFTPNGSVLVENLMVGDLVATADHGNQAIRWIGSRKILALELFENPSFQPIRISAGSLSKTQPIRDLLVSPQHRILVRSKVAQRMFGKQEVLTAAKHLLALDGIEIADDVQETTYYHVLFDRHEIVYANGAEAETLYTGPMALKSVGNEALSEITEIFPELRDIEYQAMPCRDLIDGRMGRQLAMRHQKNQIPLAIMPALG